MRAREKRPEAEGVTVLCFYGGKRIEIAYIPLL
jgi:hypothetical protein